MEGGEEETGRGEGEREYKLVKQDTVHRQQMKHSVTIKQ